MSKILLCCILLLAVLLPPAERLDIATLRPVQTVAVARITEGVCIMTDTQDVGVGKDIRGALENLKQTTPGVIYLDTADYLLIEDGAQEEALGLKGMMADTVLVYRLLGSPDLLQVSEYLQIHEGGLPIDSWEKDSKLPILDGRSDRLKLQ